MLTLIQCLDRVGDSAAIRQQVRPSHLEWIELHMHRVKVAGPIVDDDSGQTLGSFYIIEANSREDALAFLKTDPYFIAEIWQSVTPVSVKALAGTWVGGKN